MAKNAPNTPLTPAVLHILLALSAEERHGYGIMKEVESDSQGKVKMGPGTLYGSLGRMMEAGLIRESDRKVDPELDDERRVYYKITALGQATLAAELERYREVVAVARKRQLATNLYQIPMTTGCFGVGCLLSRPPGTLSSTRSGGEGWGEQAPSRDSTEFHWEMVLLAHGL